MFQDHWAEDGQKYVYDFSFSITCLTKPLGLFASIPFYEISSYDWILRLATPSSCAMR